MKNKIYTFGSLFRMIRPFGKVESKMFPISQLWEGIRPYMLKLILLCFGRPSLVQVRTKNVYSLITFLMKLSKHHGEPLTVKWLKANYVCLQRFLGDDKIPSLRSIDSSLPLPRLINGLPFIIPKGDRSRIRRGDSKTVQFWLSCFSIYRVILVPCNSKLHSITDPYTGDKDYISDLVYFIYNSPFANFFKVLPDYERWFKKVNLYPSKLSFIQTASPSNNISWHGMLTDLILLRQTGVCYAFDAYLDLVGNKYINNVLQSCMDITERGYDILLKDKSLINHKGMNPDVWVPSRKKGNFSGLVGQLAFKEEAAGKLRIFAMVDFWTQNILAPLHRELFNLIKLIPNDGTFDQDASVKRSTSKSMSSGKAYSFDLSSATDRLPIIIQSYILDMILPLKIGKAWKALLIDREYHIPEYGTEIKEGKVKYAVGQPMGALSSWAMLAVTHHFILQYASFLIGRRGWELNYEILGDDLVVFDTELADSYLEITRKLGVEINLSKSIVSPNRASFEFAKRMVMDGVNVSAISLKQLISEASISSRIGNILYFSRHGLVRSVYVLQALLSRFGKFKSLRDFDFPLISLLGYFFRKKEITPKDILMAFVNPEKEEMDLLEEEVSLPSQSLLKLSKGMLNQDGTKFLLPKSELRSELAEENLELLSDMIVLHCLSLSKEIERKFESWKHLNKNFLFGSWNLTSKEDIFLDEFIFDLVDNFEGFDPSDLVDEVETIAIKQAKIHHLDVYQALDLFERIDNIKRRWNFGIVKNTKVKLEEASSPIFNYILINLGGKSNLSYLQSRPTFKY